jgi:hypothetical protein
MGVAPGAARRMALPILLASVGLVACGGPSGRSDIAAEAGGGSLTTGRLAGWVARVPSGRPTVRDAEFAATVWVDYTLLAQAAMQGNSLTDAETVTAALLPDLTLLTLRTWHDSLVARRAPLPADLPDSLYAQDSVRVIQHILLRVTNPQDLQAISVLRSQADSLLAVVRAGTPFDVVARARSDDSSSAANGGYLPVSRRGAFPPEFERGAWALKPGDLGGVGSRAGFHLIRRPPLDEVRGRLSRYADSLATRRADSLHLDSLATTRRLAVTETAVPTLRAFFLDPASRTDSVPLATWEGGSLALAQIAAWIDLLPPRGYLDLRGASDLTLEAFVREISRQQLLLEEATAAGIRVSSADRASLDAAYRRRLRESLASLGLLDSTATLPAGEAPGRVAALMDGLTTDRVRWQPLPSALGAVLRSRAGYRLHQAGIEAATTEARAQATPRDSLRQN